MSAADEEKLRLEYEQEILAGKHQETTKNEFQRRGWKGIGVQPIFKSFLERRLLQSIEDDYRTYAKNVGHDYNDILNQSK